eukprot:464172_1
MEPNLKQMKCLCIGVISVFFIVFATLLWMLQRDSNLIYLPIINNSTLISHFLHSNSTLKQLLSHNYPILINYSHSLLNTNSNLSMLTSNKLINSSTSIINDPYADIFYYNKDLHNRHRTQNEINKIHQMWWNYEKLNIKPFTYCEEKYLGYTMDQPDRPGDLSFSKPDSFKILCNNNNYLNDIRHSHIECYNTKFKGNSYICSFKNIYGYISNENELKFKTFCNDIRNELIFTNIKKSYKGIMNIDIINDFNNSNQIIAEAKYFDMNNIWFFDNDIGAQCESHKEGDAEHIGNPWHCFGHIEYWFGIAYMRNITMDKYNITVIQSQFNDNKFGPKEAIYHFYDAFFQNVINKNVLPLSTISELLYTTSNDQVQNQNSELLWIIIICVLIAIILLFGGCFLIFKIQKIAKNKRAKMQIELEQFQTDDNRINQNHNSSDIDGNNEIFNNTLQKNITQTNIGRHNQDLNETDDELYETNDTETIGNTNTGTDTAGMEQTAGQV